MKSVGEEVMAIFAEKGHDAYFGEPVSQLEHALQAAHFARQGGASPALVVAALVHDVGHLVANTPENIADQGIDGRHEEVGQRWLAARFPKRVFEPVYLHVSAKRYLCATDSAYFGKLSPASVHSLHLQGGPMTPKEVLEFETHEFFKEAVALRHWDDQAKIPDLPTAPLSSYLELVDAEASFSR